MIPTDFLVILGFLAVLSGYSFYFGKARTVGLLFSFYFTILFYEKVPFIGKLLIFKDSPLALAINSLTVFIVFITIINLLIHKHIDSNEKDISFIKAIVFGLALTICFVIVNYYIIPLESIYNLSPKVDHIFLDYFGLFYWLLIPLGLVFFL